MLDALFLILARCALVQTNNHSAIRCQESKVQHCFRDVFMNQKPCTLGPTIKCRDYHWLRECVGGAGRCSTDVIGRMAQSEYIRTGIMYSGQCSQRRTPSLFLTKHAFVAVLGYVEGRCTATKRCPKQLLDTCALEIRQRATAESYDRHQLLRIRLDTTKAFLSLKGANYLRECGFIRETMNQLYNLHFDYCFDSHVTKCLCLEERIDKYCNQSCDFWVHKSSALSDATAIHSQCFVPLLTVIALLYCTVLVVSLK